MLADPMPFIPCKLEGLKRVWDKHHANQEEHSKPQPPVVNPARCRRPCLECQGITGSRYQLCATCRRRVAGARKPQGDPERGSVPPMANEGRSEAARPVSVPVDETRKRGRS